MIGKIYELEALRAMAALYVFLHHALFGFGIIDMDSGWGLIFRFGQEAVMMFFVLSGFVIALSLQKNSYRFGEYFKHRFLRIYPVILFAYLVSYILLVLGDHVVHFTWQDLVLNLFMLQDISLFKPGVWVDPLFGNAPLWSLSYEWWFYMVFFFHFALAPTSSKLLLSGFVISLLGAISYSLVYNQVSLFAFYYFIWLSGAALLLKFHETEKIGFAFIGKIAFFYLVLLASFSVLNLEKGMHGIGEYPVLQLRHYASALALILFFYVLYKYVIPMVRGRLYKRFISSFAMLAPISFGLYVIHYPVVSYLTQYLNSVNVFGLFLLSFLLSMGLAYFAERKLYRYIKNKSYLLIRINK